MPRRGGCCCAAAAREPRRPRAREQALASGRTRGGWCQQGPARRGRRTCLGVGHARDAAVAADVGGHALQRHDRHGARLLGDARLLRGHHIHDHAALRWAGWWGRGRRGEGWLTRRGRAGPRPHVHSGGCCVPLRGGQQKRATAAAVTQVHSAWPFTAAPAARSGRWPGAGAGSSAP